MGKYITMLLVVLLASCHQHTRHSHEAPVKDIPSSGNFGELITQEGALDQPDYAVIFEEAETAGFKIAGTIEASCIHSGCWMDIALADGETVHITFLDDAFTIPLDAAGKNAIAEGTVYRTLVPVETLQNYAREDGKSEEEIAAITEPGYAYRFIAHGVIISE